MSSVALTQAPPQRRHEYVALALMYFAQGVPAGLAFNALGVLIRQGGHSIAEVGLTGFAFLPWGLKFLWAGAIDNACTRFGYARVIGVTQLLAVAMYLVLSAFSPASSLHAALMGVVVLNTICATQDIATNAYAVQRLQGRAAGPANAIQVAGFIVGMLAGGAGVLLVHERLGWAASMQSMALLMVLLYLPLLFGTQWRSRAPAVQAAARVRLRDLREHADLLWALAIAVLFKFASTAVATLVQPWLVDRGLSLAQVGGLQTSNLLATALGGVLIGIALVRRLGNRRAVVIGCVLSAAFLGVPWLLNAAGVHDLRVMYLAFALQSVVDGAMYVAIWALFMNWASPARPGTDYTVMQCCESLANAIAAGAIAGLGQHFGYGSSFLATWLIGVLIVGVIVYGVRRLSIAGEAAM